VRCARAPGLDELSIPKLTCSLEVTRSITCGGSEAFAPEVCRQRNQSEADADLPPDHGIRPRCSIDEPRASVERVPDGSGHEEQCRQRCGTERQPERAPYAATGTFV
jgi:hypothetical protein